MGQKIKNNFGWIILIVLSLAAFFIWLAVGEFWVGGEVKIIFFDVGQGSAILVAASNGNQVLIDGGPGGAALVKLGAALPLFDRKIELLILTHPDSDHLNGLIETAERYEIGQVLETGIADASAAYAAWRDLIKRKNIPVSFALAGQKIKIADNLRIDILHPLKKIAGRDFGEETNRTSIVGKIIYGRNSVLFTGDADAAVEKPLIMSGADLRADILAVGHHGSKNSTSAEFLAAIAPRLAAISVGAKNRYGHPAPELLDRLKNLEILRTDLLGNLEFLCDFNACRQTGG